MVAVPKLIVLDLDYTIWPCWCDTHIAVPIKSEAAGSRVRDKSGSVWAYYPEVPDILKAIEENGLSLALASRTCAPEIAKNLLRLLIVDGRPGQSYFQHAEWGTGSKVKHLQRLHATTGIEYADMILYDDESRNRDVERKLGVTFMDVPHGLNKKVFHEGIELWRKRNGHPAAPKNWTLSSESMI